jgi:hypothetical protein
MLVNARSGTGWRNAAQRMDRTANWCTGGCWFTLAYKMTINYRDGTYKGRFSVLQNAIYWIFFFPKILLVVDTHKMPTMYLSPKKTNLIQLLQCDFTLGRVLKSRPSQNKYRLALPRGARGGGASYGNTQR